MLSAFEPGCQGDSIGPPRGYRLARRAGIDCARRAGIDWPAARASISLPNPAGPYYLHGTMSLTILTQKNRRALLTLAIAMIAGAVVSRIPFEGLSEAGSLTFGIFVTAALLWVLEPFPLYVTSFIIVILEVILLGRSGGPLGLKGSGYSIFLSPFFSSVVVLLFGGFVMAQAVKRYSIDNWLLRKLLGRVGNRPAAVLFGMMVLCAFLSMWISNTATTALMMAVACRS